MKEDDKDVMSVNEGNQHDEEQTVDSQIHDLISSFEYSLQDKAYKVLSELLKRDYRITVTTRLKRDFVIDNFLR